MLLNEILDVERPREIKKSIDPFGFPWRVAGKKGEELGGGVTAQAFKSDKPNTIRKVSYHKSLNDAYIQYIKVILQHQDNPFFPRIYNAKIYKEPKTTHSQYKHYFFANEASYALFIEMEKLIPLKNPKMINTAPHIFRQLGLDYKDYDKSLWDNPYFIEEIKQESNNPQFVEAVNILEPLFDKFISDLHKNNMMVRLTSSGPQLVITDPFQPELATYYV